ncbi:hypothetical protein COV53_02810 [Candidatus Gottesmanbacteria bacterium CG11_big_fil_rev_8_21_14_0_20_37_11]|uniref:Resolvase HTH domain-containing protein n=2 Tax=Candidatus Gottesmaniibacteriota TaxID=1752720 RepID=A0A2M7RPP7_9BACT|nr:MAG: hypothetical protein COX23_05455 [Candidatus Gottesmanbacteria bacterium CG23_combo_of_CG06-09_8_20_14_all_37_19]PIR08482.1 MAG: hypothetical protein COV53_02810 [Candidatus Gottesmanbacteria bacterium CG11_big_fil_rev_8_21_14_0_20_37_11]PIZ02242.1 MAG: hypothetical protein COY59_05830 [Candidatus Gottesmanbacteria bacterium CG_4_10_14_0_8_um_filter_37_24]
MAKQKLNTTEIDKMIDLREHGYSLSEIKHITGKAQSTVYRYIKNVKILPEYISVWESKRGGSYKIKRRKEESAFEDGKKLIGKLSNREKLLFLCALYWAEGSKKDFGLSNTDPGLIQVFVSNIRELLNIEDSRLRISIRIYEDLDKDKCLSYWSKIVGIPKDKFVSVNILSGKKKGKLEYGMCRIRVSKGGDILKKINGINKAIRKLYAPIA